MSSGDTPNWANWMDAVNFRMGIISPLVSYMRAHPGDRKGLMKMAGRLAADACLHKRTVVRWLEAYGEGQVAGLAPRYHSCRSDHRLHVRFETLLDEAVAMRDASPTIGVMEIIRCLEGRHPGIEGVLKRSTMQRHLQKRGHGRKQMLQRAEASGGPFFSRYRLVHRFQQVQGDIKEPPRNCVVSERGLPAKPYIQLWMDNHSRRIVSFRVSLHERSDLALASLRALVQAYGVPESILTDQGSVYRGKKFAHCTHTLGIRHHRSRPYRPQAKGMNERANGTFDDLLLQVGQMRQVRFSAFCRLVKMRIDEYNRTPHSALTIRHEDGTTEAQTPDQCFFSDTYPIRLASPDIVGHAFRMFEGRKILFTSII